MIKAERKVWGETTFLFEQNGVELHRITGQPNAYCSEHVHRTKFNVFIVEKGRLLVRTFDDDHVASEVVLDEGHQLTVRPGLWHQFEVLQDVTVALEVYWADSLLEAQNPGAAHIERRTFGGIREHARQPA